VPFEAQWGRFFAPTSYLGDVFLNGGYYGGAYRFDGTSGAERWFTELPPYDQWTPAVDGAHVYAYVGEHQPGLYVLNRGTGKLVFMIPDPNFSWDGWSMRTAPVLTHDGDIVATHDGRLIRFDVQGRRIAWEVDRDFWGQATVRGNVIYVNDGGRLTAWDAVNGTFLAAWSGPEARRSKATSLLRIPMCSCSRSPPLTPSTCRPGVSTGRMPPPAALPLAMG
jgi:outer membrane protein assembly factor BamB